MDSNLILWDFILVNFRRRKYLSKTTKHLTKNPTKQALQRNCMHASMHVYTLAAVQENMLNLISDYLWEFDPTEFAVIQPANNEQRIVQLVESQASHLANTKRLDRITNRICFFLTIWWFWEVLFPHVFLNMAEAPCEFLVNWGISAVLYIREYCVEWGHFQ